ncbi:flavin reductase [Adlercreutzia sp. ZJ304]|uniref:flavin reductase n=1 Tax=Adlercreutzia sp. ZJ304 TaxID=2709791 RepID=UPI0013EE3DAA|nr:flavin reductase [Adlercreutzia sp. ZJ304]
MIDRKAFHTLSYGLFIISSKNGAGRKVGCVANTFQQIASEPALVCVSLNKLNATTAAIQETGMFTVSVLSETCTMDLIGAFGFHSSLDIDKFESAEYELDSKELPCITQMTVANFSIEVQQTIDAGSHLLFVGKVREARKISDDSPITYSYYRNVLRGKTPPKAANYQPIEKKTEPQSQTQVQVQAQEPQESQEPQEPAKSTRHAWRCTLCGHIEYVDELPDDFVCPICGVDKSFFERIEIE